MNRRLSTLVLVAAAILTSGALVRNASAAQFLYEVRLTVPALPPDSIRANDAHLLFAGTGNSIKNATSKSGVIRTIAGTGNGVDLTFSDKLLGGTVIVFHFEADFNNVTFNSGTWTNNGAVIRSLTVTAFGLKPFVATPGVSSIGLVLLSLLTLGSGIYIIGRRRSATA